MHKYIFYIGSNNSTKELEAEKAIAIIGEVFDGFTYSKLEGYWKGSQEDTLKVEVITEKLRSEAEKVARKLKTYLQQDSILLEVRNNITCEFI